MAWQIINQHLLGILVSNPVETYSSHQQTLFWCTNLGEQKNGVGVLAPICLRLLSLYQKMEIFNQGKGCSTRPKTGSLHKQSPKGADGWTGGFLFTLDL